MKRASEADILPDGLIRDIERAGYYPALVADIVATALGGDQVQSHLVHLETTFDREVIRRHVTVLAVTSHRLVIAHADDHAHDPTVDPRAAETAGQESVATATTESVALSRIRSVMLNHVVPDPARYRKGDLGREVTLSVGWGGMSRLDLMPATCADPTCDGDHGYEGAVASDDIALRVSASADGEQAFAGALRFAHALSALLAR